MTTSNLLDHVGILDIPGRLQPTESKKTHPGCREVIEEVRDPWFMKSSPPAASPLSQ